MPSKSVPSSLPKKYRALAEAAVAQGWRVTETRNGHYSFTPPLDPDRDRCDRCDFNRPIVCAGSGGKGRGDANLLAALRRAGLNLPR